MIERKHFFTTYQKWDLEFNRYGCSHIYRCNWLKINVQNKCLSKNYKRKYGVPPQLSGFACAFRTAAPGSNPKYTIYTFINLNLNCDMLKR